MTHIAWRICQNVFELLTTLQPENNLLFILYRYIS
jgi:hypothetical protein